MKMWSRHLVPKPKDWPDHVDIVGAFVDKSAANSKQSGPPVAASSSASPAATRTPQEESMDAFLDSSLPPPIFIGFGSMIVADTPALIKVILMFSDFCYGVVYFIFVDLCAQLGWDCLVVL